MADDDFDQRDLEEYARLSGITVAEAKKELLRERLLRRGRSEPAATTSLARSTGFGDASGAVQAAERGAITHQPSFGSPVTRYEKDTETAAEAQERWYNEEAELPDGVHGLGGQSAGGIFGSGPISTSIYDPEAMARSEGRASGAVHMKMLSVLERMEQRLDEREAATRGALPGAARRRLPQRGSR